MENEENDLHVVAAAVKAEPTSSPVPMWRISSSLPRASRRSRRVRSCPSSSSIRSVLLALLRQQAEDVANPPMTFDEVLQRLARWLRSFVAAVCEHLGRSTLFTSCRGPDRGYCSGP